MFGAPVAVCDSEQTCMRIWVRNSAEQGRKVDDYWKAHLSQ
jgi:hypothetical protein